MKTLLVGYGNMGKLLHKSISNAYVIQPSAKEDGTFFPSVDRLPKGYEPDVVLFAVKPNVLKEVCRDYKFFNKALFISIVAGVATEWLMNELSTESIVRIMPNVAIEVGQSANLAFAKKGKEAAIALLQKTGPFYWLEKESLLDVLTPMAGSSPALYFLFTELLIKSAVEAGVDEKLASDAVRQAFLGSALLAKKGGDLEILRRSVTSKGGVTESALEVLGDDFSKLIGASMKSALKKLGLA
jgi:pyrroline-5-carboxylate reductase